MFLAHLIKLVLRFFSYAFLFFGSCRAQTLTGVVYYNNSGPSGKGAGQVNLMVGDKLRELQYAKPLRFTRRACYDTGAVWTVVAEPRIGSGDWISRATCEGKVDERVHGPWLTARAYLDLMALGSTKGAELLSSRSAETSELAMKTIEGLDFTGYRDFGGNGHCLDIAKAQDEMAQVYAGEECYLTKGAQPVRISFSIIREQDKWKIDRVEVETER